MRFTFLQLPLFPFRKRKVKPNAKVAPASPRKTSKNVVDPELFATWSALIEEYFPDRRDLLSYNVTWARRRQKRTLGCCNLTRRRVTIAQELRQTECYRWVEAVLYHELCHAVLGTETIKRGGRRAWHGVEFKSLEARNPHSVALQHWMKSGGWRSAVRSARSRSVWTKRNSAGIG